MKKFGKILALILSLAVIVGALIVSSFAAEEETSAVTPLVHVYSSLNAPDGWDGTTLTKTQVGGNASGSYSISNSTLQRYTNEDNDTVAIMYGTDGTELVSSTWTHFTPHDWDAKNVAEGTTKYATGNLVNIKYVVYEADFMSPTGQFPVGAMFSFRSGYADTTGTNQQTEFGLRFTEDGVQFTEYFWNGTGLTTTWLSDTKVTWEELGIDIKQFFHVSTIYEYKTFANKTIGHRSHLYINGKYVISSEWTTEEEAIPLSAQLGGKPNEWIQSAKIAPWAKNEANTFRTEIVQELKDGEMKDVPHYYSTGVDTIAYNNVSYRAFGYSNYGNLDAIIANGDDITAWNGNIYSADALSHGSAIAKVGETKYYSIAEAVAAANGGTVELLYSPTVTTVIDTPCTIKVKDASDLNKLVGNGSELVNNGDGTVTFVAVEVGYTEITDSGKEIKHPAELSLKEVFALAAKGSTIRLEKDVAYDSAANGTIGSFKDDITLDLNGKILDARQASSKTKSTVFSVTGSHSFAITSTAKGGKVFYGHYKGSTGADSSYFITYGTAAELTIGTAGDKQGEYFTYCGGHVAGSYANAGSINIIGGYYAQNAPDAFGFIIDNNPGYLCWKDSTIVLTTKPVIVAYGRSDYTKEYPDPQYIFDNCVIDANGRSIFNYSSEKVDITITNTVINGDITPDQVYEGGAIMTPGTITLGAGNYITGTIGGTGANAATIVYANGVTPVSVNVPLTFTGAKNSFTTDGAAADLGLVAYSSTAYAKTMTVAEGTPTVDVQLLNSGAGNAVITTVPMYVGAYKAISIETVTPAVDMWVNSVHAIEHAANVYDDRVTAETTSFAVEAVERYEAALNDVFFNYSLGGNAQFNVYVPIKALRDAGGTVTSMKVGGSDRTSNLDGTSYYTINDYAGYRCTYVYPGIYSLKKDYDIEVAFTYGGQEFSVSFTASCYDYAEYILDTGKAEYSVKQRTFAAAFVQYAGAMVFAQDGTNEFSTNVDALLAKDGVAELLERDGIALPENFTSNPLKTDTESYATWCKYVKSLEGVFGTYGGYGFKVTTHDQATLQATFGEDTIYPLYVTFNWIGDDAGTGADNKDADVHIHAANGYIKMTDLNNAFVLRVHDSNDDKTRQTLASIEYSFSNYATALYNADPVANAKYIDLLKAAVVLGNAADFLTSK